MVEGEQIYKTTYRYRNGDDYRLYWSFGCGELVESIKIREMLKYEGFGCSSTTIDWRHGECLGSIATTCHTSRN